MSLDRTDPLFRLYLETVPTRPSAADPYRMADGPTAAARELLLEREKWELLLDFPTDEEEGRVA